MGRKGNREGRGPEKREERKGKGRKVGERREQNRGERG